MNKITGTIIGIAASIALLYFIGFIIALIAFIVVVLLNWIIKKNQPEWTEWQFTRTASPKVFTEDGVKYYQRITMWNRYNNITKEWDSKKVIDPKKKVSEATEWDDLFYLGTR